MSIFLGMVGIGGFLGCLIGLIALAIKKYPKKSLAGCGIGMAVCFALFIVGVSMPSDDIQVQSAYQSSQASDEQSLAAPKESPQSYAAGEKAMVDSSVGQYSVTIDGAKEGASRNELADSQPKRIVMINYSYENVSCEQDVTVSSIYFHVYNSSGELLEVYPSIDASGPEHAISVGKHNSASAAYGLDDDSKQITIELYDIFNPVNRVATYTIDINS